MYSNTKTAPAPTQEAPGASTRSRFERWAPVAGIAFVVLMVVGSMLVGNVPSPDASRAEVAHYLTDDSRQMHNIVGAYLWVIGALAFLWFLIRLRNDLRRAEGGKGTLSNLAYGAGVGFAAVWTVSAATFASVAYAVSLRNAPVTDTDLVRVLPPLGRLELLLGGGFFGILVLLATAAVVLRTGVLPRWLGWLAIAAAIALLFDVTYLTIFPFWGWILIASVVMLVRRKAPLTSVDAHRDSLSRTHPERVA
jgi:hypothetical protein